MDTLNADPMAVPLIARLHNAGLQHITDALWQSRRPSIRLVRRASAAADSGNGSRLGGLPNLPEDIEWPRAKAGHMAFVAQIELADVTRFLNPSDLPTAGRLCLFYDGVDCPWGFDPQDKAFGWRVIHVAAPSPCAPRAFPEDVAADLRFRAVPLDFRLEWTFPDVPLAELVGYVRRSGRTGKLQEEEYWEILGELQDDGGPYHRMFGYADVVQSPMELEAQLVSNGLYCGTSAGWDDPRAAQLAPGARDWRLLLQIDSDGDAEMMWGDLGRLYVWMREQDMRSGTFDAAWLIVQCH
jgi:uncharacterized protein YwqG